MGVKGFTGVVEPRLGASERLVESHLPLVRSIARRHLGLGEEFEDLVQVGSVGLMKAAGRFDPGRGVAFGAFAARVVEGEIRHHLRDRVRTERREFAPGEQADDIDAPRAAGDGLAACVDRLSVASGVRCLSQRERRIVFLRFHADLTEREIGQELGLSQAHVSRLLKRALERLRGELGPNGDITPDTVRLSSDQKLSPTIPWVGESGESTLSRYLQLPYRFDVRADREGGGSAGWVASVAEFPGCVARGDTRERAMARLREAMRKWIAMSLADGREVPTPTDQEITSRSQVQDHPEADAGADVPGKQEEAGSRPARGYSGRFLVRIPAALHEELAHAAQRRQISLNRLVVDLLSTTVRASDPVAVQAGQRAAVQAGAPVAVDAGEPAVVESNGAQPGPSATAGPPQPVQTAPRWIRVALATNLVLLVLAAIAAIVVLVLALQHGA